MTALRTCPHCLAPVRSNGRPTCLCAAADADDFDPLRVRPYVSLPEEAPPDGTRTAHGPTGSGPETDSRSEAGHGRGSGHGVGPPARGTADAWEDLPGVDAAVHIATGPPPLPAATSEPLVPRARRPAGPTSRTYRSTPEAPPPPDPPPPAPRPPARPPHRRHALPVALVAAGAAVVAAAVLISTDALSGGTRDRAAPPDRGTVAPTAASPTGGAPSATRNAPPSPPSPHRSPSSGATGIGTPEATVKLSRTAVPPPPPPTRASGSVTDSPGGDDPTAAPTGPIVLREGSSGPEVTELQGRLRQLALYAGAGDGRYDADVRDAVSRYQRTYRVTGDPDGVYGPRTRQSLEARTREP
ncbi:peptidoglycan-binding domain-containing protein [Streptomyces sp. NRRL S-337]|uniref:peptidoglycan-binding domain-containing protein n=1 Tax=Streptomyces sp. NRRL S-337 TaxID=1463900 RepID=UPI001F43DD71|nr:peptidoglycan-binding domain-containing protein [Streptomyces sp. NRRL S-337]